MGMTSGPTTGMTFGLSAAPRPRSAPLGMTPR